MKYLTKFLKTGRKFWVNFMFNYSRTFHVKYYKNVRSEICNNFEEHVENISGYRNIVKNLRKFKTF